jgi:hypothetical protein
MIQIDENVGVGRRIEHAFAGIPPLRRLPTRVATLHPLPCPHCAKEVCSFCGQCRNENCESVACELMWCDNKDCDLTMQDCSGSAGDCKGHDDEEETIGGRDSECLTDYERNSGMKFGMGA